jgi:hypothetical protein
VVEAEWMTSARIAQIGDMAEQLEVVDQLDAAS